MLLVKVKMKDEWYRVVLNCRYYSSLVLRVDELIVIVIATSVMVVINSLFVQGSEWEGVYCLGVYSLLGWIFLILLAHPCSRSCDKNQASETGKKCLGSREELIPRFLVSFLCLPSSLLLSVCVPAPPLFSFALSSDIISVDVASSLQACRCEISE